MFRVHVLTEEGVRKVLDRPYGTEAKAEADAFWLLGVTTPTGVITNTYVVDAQDNIMNEFEF
jgi:hypothetical protein